MLRQMVPVEYQSKVPARLRDMAQACAGKIGQKELQLLKDAAAEIEGSEEAYAVLVSELEDLRKKLAHTENNLRATIAMVPCSPMFK